MKTCKIILRQDGSEFEVVRFSNTVQLSIGMRVPVSRVEEWCSMTRVQVEVIGMVEEKENEELNLDGMEAKPLSRPDTFTMISQADVASTKNDNQPF